MSNESQDLSCRKIGIILKDYSCIVNSLSKKIGAVVDGEKDQWGLSLGGIPNPYYDENTEPQWSLVNKRGNANDYIDFIRKVYSTNPSFDVKMNLTDSELNFNSSSVGTFNVGTSISSVLNAIQSYVTNGDGKTSAGSAYSKLYSLHGSLDSAVGVVRNYNMNQPVANINGTSDTMLGQMGIVYRGQSLMDGFIRWASGGAFADYDRISQRMSMYDFTEKNYGYGLNQNFGNGGMSYTGMEMLTSINGPLDEIEKSGLHVINKLGSYSQYYSDLGWKSKSFYTTSMSYVINGTKPDALDPHLSKGDAVVISDPSQPFTGVYPFDRKTKRNVSDTFAMSSSYLYDLYQRTYDEHYTRFKNEGMNKILGDGTIGNTKDYRQQYVEAENMTNISSADIHKKRVELINDEVDEKQTAYQNVSSTDKEIKDNDAITVENGQATGVFRGMQDSASLEYQDLLSRTNSAFVHGDYESLVARFHTSGGDGNIKQETQTALSKQFGLSHGRNLLSKYASAENPSYTNGYENPYCRVWTYHHQYHTLQNAIRGGAPEESNTNQHTGGAFKDSWKLGDLVRDLNYDYTFRATYTGDTSNKDNVLFMDGQDSLDDLSVLNHRNNLVNITPKTDGYGGKFDIKRCMFSIENLAWRDNAIKDGDNGYYSTLDSKQIGPLGGRIMWFPPYGLTYSESSNAQWGGNYNFIGRGEPVKIYKNTTRAGSINFMLLVDHPSIIDYIDKEKDGQNGIEYNNKGFQQDSVDDTGSTEQTLLRFFAGCDVLEPKKLPEQITVQVPEVHYDYKDVQIPNPSTTITGTTVTTPEKEPVGETTPSNPHENVNIAPPSSDVTPTPTLGDPKKKETQQKYNIVFATFFPNNYTAFFKGDFGMNSKNTGNNGSYYYGDDVGYQYSVDPDKSKVSITYTPTSSGGVSQQGEVIEQNLLYLANGVGNQTFLNGFNKASADTFYAKRAITYREIMDKLIPVEYANRRNNLYSYKYYPATNNEDPKKVYKLHTHCEYNKSKSEYEYKEQAVENKDQILADSHLGFITLDLDTKWTIYKEDPNRYVLNNKQFGVEDWTGFTQYMKGNTPSGITGAYASTQVSTYELNSEKAYVTETYQDGDSFFGYEMGVSDDYGISHAHHDYRFFSENKAGQTNALSAHVTPVFMILKKDSSDQIYYMPTTWGHWDADYVNELIQNHNHNVEIGLRNDWMYRTDNIRYKSAKKRKNGQTIFKRFQQEVMSSKVNGQSVYAHDDYADCRSFGLNSQLGIDQIVKTPLFENNGFTATMTLNDNVDTIKYSKQDNNTYLATFADFMVACYLIKHKIDDLTDEVKAKLNLKPDMYNDDSVKLIKYALKDSSDLKISLSGVASQQGVSNGTSDVNSQTMALDFEKEPEDANSCLSTCRAWSISAYTTYILQKSGRGKDFIGNAFESYTNTSISAEQADVSDLSAKQGRACVCNLSFTKVDTETTVEKANSTDNAEETMENGASKIHEENYQNKDGNEKSDSTTLPLKTTTVPATSTVENNYITRQERVAYTKMVDKQVPSKSRYEDEYSFFKTIEREKPFLRDKIKEKIKYFDPAYHSVSPEGFNARLTFLHQCTRQGPTYDSSNSNNASNMSFGRPPVCVLRLGDFWYSKIIINNINFQYEPLWDLNPEGIGIQPMVAKVRMSFEFLGGQDLGGPISRLQNAVSFNYYANTRVYDDRAEQIAYDENAKSPYEFDFVPNIYQ